MKSQISQIHPSSFSNHQFFYLIYQILDIKYSFDEFRSFSELPEDEKEHGEDGI